MEVLNVKLGNDEAYDKAVHGGLPQYSDIEIITKDQGTVSGAPVAVITFDVHLPDGTVGKAQAVTTIACLQSALSAINGRYGKDRRPGW